MSNPSDSSATDLSFLARLIDIIHERKQQMHAPEAESSYTVSLFHDGLNKIAQKVGEEAVELIIEAKDSDDGRFKNEAADLIYHLLVLLEEKQIPLAEVVKVLEARHN